MVFGSEAVAKVFPGAQRPWCPAAAIRALGSAEAPGLE